jgi:hypothetical protein
MRAAAHAYQERRAGGQVQHTGQHRARAGGDLRGGRRVQVGGLAKRKTAGLVPRIHNVGDKKCKSLRRCLMRGRTQVAASVLRLMEGAERAADTAVTNGKTCGLPKQLPHSPRPSQLRRTNFLQLRGPALPLPRARGASP